MSPVIMFYFTSSMLNMFCTLIHPSSGACDFSIRVADCSLLHGYHLNLAKPKLQHTSKQEHTTSVVIQ